MKNIWRNSHKAEANSPSRMWGQKHTNTQRHAHPGSAVDPTNGTQIRRTTKTVCAKAFHRPHAKATATTNPPTGKLSPDVNPESLSRRQASHSVRQSHIAEQHGNESKTSRHGPDNRRDAAYRKRAKYAQWEVA